MRFSLCVAVVLVAGVAPSFAQDAQQRTEWNRPFAPFTVIENVHYVGVAGISAFLVTGPQGHILLDGGLPESAALIAANIRKLGFRLRDVKIILINHAHFDHAGGLAELKRLTGARLIASRIERLQLEAGRTQGRPELASFRAVRVDRVVADGEEVHLGPIVLTTVLTPGHTAGSTSWATTVAGRQVLFASSLTVAGQRLVGDRDYPAAAADFAASFKRLRARDADVFLTFHPEFFDMQAKRARQLAGEREAFVDRSELARVLDRAERGFAKELAAQRATGPGAVSSTSSE